MENYCAFSNDHKCILWTDYAITRDQLDEANTLCHGNWIEIQHKIEYIDILQNILSENGISFPMEYER